MKKQRVKFLLFVYYYTEKCYRKYFSKKKRHWKFNEAQLLQFEEDSLGKKLGEFYQKYGFTMVDNRGNHDVHHLITGCGINFEHEIAMQFLLIGNGKLNAHMLAAIILGTFILPEYIGLYKRSYLKGKSMRPFHQWDFEDLLFQNFENLKDFIFQKEIITHY